MIKRYGFSMLFMALAIFLLSSCSGTSMSSINKIERCQQNRNYFDDDCHRLPVRHEKH
jgi:uncharacterized lipoprotein YajG